MSMEEAAAEIVSPAVAEGPYRVVDGFRAAGMGRTPKVVADAAGVMIARPYGENLRQEEAQAHLFAASWEMRELCGKAAVALHNYATVDAETLTLEVATDLRDRLFAVLRKAGLRPCDDPALVPEVMKAQPQCVHGEKGGAKSFCPKHGKFLQEERHEHPTNGGIWYTYVCDGYLEEEKGSEG